MNLKDRLVQMAGRPVSGADPAAKKTFYLGIGAPRSGTTWLYENLRKSADLWLPPVKELRYFRGSRSLEAKAVQADKVIAEPTCDAQDRAFIDNWRAQPDGVAESYLPMFPDLPRIGEISPIYCVMNAKEVALMRELLADWQAHVFFLMRNPFLRDLSHVIFTMHRQRNRTAPYTPDEYLDFVSTPAFRHRSNYTRAIENWGSVFGEDLHTFYYDDLESDPVAFFAAFCDEIGIGYRADAVTAGKKNSAGYQRTFDGDLPDALIEHLRDRHMTKIPTMEALPQARRDAWMAQISAHSGQL